MTSTPQANRETSPFVGVFFVVFFALLTIGIFVLLWPRGESRPTTDTTHIDAPSRQPSEPRPQATAAESTTPTALPDSQAPAATPTLDDPDASPVPMAVRGRVVDLARDPVAGARVRVVIPPSTVRETESGIDGRFQLTDVPRPRRGSRIGGVVAFDESRSRAGVEPLRVDADEQGQRGISHGRYGPLALDVDIGVVVLEEAHEASVLVRERGRPVGGARITLAVDYVRTPAAILETDTSGRATVLLPYGMLHARASAPPLSGVASGSVQGPPLIVDLGPSQTVGVLVVDAATQAPIEGAEVDVHERFHGPADSPRSLDLGISPTDSTGRTRIEGLPHGAPRLEVAVTRFGYTAPNDPNGLLPARQRLDGDETEIVVELAASETRTIRVPLLAGEVGIPPDGTPLEMRKPSRSGHARRSVSLPATGRVENEEIAVDGVPRGAFIALASTPEGNIAAVGVSPDSDVGIETAFRLPRTVLVTVVDSTGSPVEEVVVSIHNQGGNYLVDPARTDAQGQVRLEPLFGGLTEIRLQPSPSVPFRSVATVNLEQGDPLVEVHVVVPKRSTLALAVRLDGKPGLPGKMRIVTVASNESMGTTAQILDEDPSNGTCRVAVHCDPREGPLRGSLYAEGFLSASFEASVDLFDTEIPIPVELERSATLVVHVDRPLDLDIHLRLQQRRVEAPSGWASPLGGVHDELSYPNGPHETFVFRNLHPGTYRIHEKRSGTFTSPVEVHAAGEPVEIDLDLRTIERVSGVVEVPVDCDLSLVRVLAESERAKMGISISQLPSGIELPFDGGIRVDDTGRFEVSVATDEVVRLRPWHPALSPASNGTAEVRYGSPRLVTLRLESGTRAMFRAPEGSVTGSFVRIRLFDGVVAAANEVASLLGRVDEGTVTFTGYEPGDYTVWIDPGHDYAPVTLPDVALSDGETWLANPPYTRGSAILIAIDGVPEPRVPPVWACGKSTTYPSYYRAIRSKVGDTLLTLPGFGPGGCEVGIVPQMPGATRRSDTVTLDGTTDERIVYPIR